MLTIHESMLKISSVETNKHKGKGVGDCPLCVCACTAFKVPKTATKTQDNLSKDVAPSGTNLQAGQVYLFNDI